jgi:hypothetical protein
MLPPLSSPDCHLPVVLPQLSCPSVISLLSCSGHLFHYVQASCPAPVSFVAWCWLLTFLFDFIVHSSDTGNVFQVFWSRCEVNRKEVLSSPSRVKTHLFKDLLPLDIRWEYYGTNSFNWDQGGREKDIILIQFMRHILIFNIVQFDIKEVWSFKALRT